MFKLSIEIDGPNEESIVSLLEQIKAALADNSAVSAEAAQIKDAVDGFRAANAQLVAKIAELQASLDLGTAVTDAELQEVLNLVNAKNDAIANIFTPEPMTQPAGPGE